MWPGKNFQQVLETSELLMHQLKDICSLIVCAFFFFADGLWKCGNAVHFVSAICVILTDVSASLIYQSKHHCIIHPLHPLQLSVIKANTSNTLKFQTLSHFCFKKIHILTFNLFSKPVHCESGVIKRWYLTRTMRNTEGYIWLRDLNPKVRSVLTRGKLRWFRVELHNSFAFWAHHLDCENDCTCRQFKPVRLPDVSGLKEVSLKLHSIVFLNVVAAQNMTFSMCLHQTAREQC